MGISYTASAENDCLLDYAIATTPDPLQVSPQDGDPSLATLTIAVSNGTQNAIYCKQITFSFAIGDLAQDLTSVETGFQVSASPSDQWHIESDTNSPGVFIATPTGSGQITEQGLVFQISSIQVNYQVGTFVLNVKENSSTDNINYQNYYNAYNIAKFPYAFYVSGFVANTPQVQLGSTATLSWSGSDDADYMILYYDASHNQQQQDVTSVRIWPTPALYSDTNFQLQVMAQSQGETVETYLSAFVSVADPFLTATTLTVLQSTTLQGDTTVGSDLAVTGSLNVSQTSTLADTVVTGTLSSNNAVGVISPQAQALFFAGNNYPTTGQVETDGFLLGQVGLPFAASSPASTIQISVRTADNQPLYTAYATGSDGANPGPASLLLPVQKGCVWQTACQGQCNPPFLSFTWIPFGVGSTSSAVAFNAGGGNAGPFLADNAYSGGSTNSTTASIDTSGVSNPAPQAVYQTSRSGSEFDYFLNLPNGNYTVRLHFAEIFFSGTDQRLFNVTCGGQPVLTNYDICAAAGSPNKAVVESFAMTTSVNQGAWIRFFGSSNYNATLNGIEVFASQSTTTIAINAGGNTTGSFLADRDYSGGFTYSTNSSIDTTGVSNPAPQAVYQTERFDADDFTYTISNLFTAKYIVRLHFAEIYFSGSNQRVFNVTLNGNTVLANFDIFATAGAKNKAVVEEFQVAYSNVVIIEFQNITGGAKISGIEVLPWIAINAGGGDAGAFVADNDYNGGSTYATTSSINTSGVSNPAPQAVYQTERHDDNNFTYTISNLTLANYTVRLHFAEIFFSGTGQRTFNVTLNGNTVLSNFDIFATAGAQNKAIVEEFQVAASNGAVVIEFQNVTGGAKVSGIEAFPNLS